MVKPELSPDFTIETMEDFYKYREHLSIRWSNMTSEERITDIKKGARGMLELIERTRQRESLT